MPSFGTVFLAYPISKRLRTFSACEQPVNTERDHHGISETERQVHAQPERGLLLGPEVTVIRPITPQRAELPAPLDCIADMINLPRPHHRPLEVHGKKRYETQRGNEYNGESESAFHQAVSLSKSIGAAPGSGQRANSP